MQNYKLQFELNSQMKILQQKIKQKNTNKDSENLKSKKAALDMIFKYDLGLIGRCHITL